MKNAKIAKVLKEYRKLNHLTVNEVAVMLKQQALPVAPKTIYGWESGQSQPDADTLLLLCDLYNIQNILETFGYSDGDDFHVTTFEKRLIQEYRKHPQMQAAINKLLGLDAEQ